MGNPSKRYAILFTTIDTYVRAHHRCFVTELDFGTIDWQVCIRPTAENTRSHGRSAYKYFRLSVEEVAELCAANGLGSSLWERIDQELRSIGDPDKTLQIRGAVERNIRAAFRGVTLGAGITLRGAQLIDGGSASSGEQTQPFTGGEIIDDWELVQLGELDRDSVAHLDALGFRYYIPALMLSVLKHYDSSSMRVIGTLTGLYPKKDNAWEYHMQRYSLFDATQKTAIAQFLEALPKLVDLDSTDKSTAERAVRDYWGKYLNS